MKGCLIVANGKAPSKGTVKFFLEHGYQFLIAADGGANWLVKMNFFPNVLIGDMDSVDRELMKEISYRTDIKYLDRQSDTDVEKSIKYSIRRRFEAAVILGGTGDRLDHTIGNLSIMLKYCTKIDLGFLHHNSYLKPIRGKVKIATVPGETISLYGFDKKTLFTSEGLKYKLKKKPLQFGVAEGTSNSATGAEVSLNVEGGTGFIIRDFNILKQNGFFSLD